MITKDGTKIQTQQVQLLGHCLWKEGMDNTYFGSERQKARGW